MKILRRSVISVILCCALLLSVPLTAAADGGTAGDGSGDETVYVIAGADGSVQKIILGSMVGKDEGSSSYSIDGGTVWDVNSPDSVGSDVSSALPVRLTAQYTLNGRTVRPGELAGKSGHLKVRYDYAGLLHGNVWIKGRQENMTVPYIMLTGLLLDNESFSNVTVSNGKLFDDGSRTAVIGFAFPGLQDDLKIAKKDAELPEYVEIEADVSDCSFPMAVTLAVNSVFADIDADKIDSVEDLKDAAGELNSAMTQLIDGSSALYNGIATLLDKSSALATGVGKLADGTAKLVDGSEKLKNGTAQLYIGSVNLSNALGTLASKNNAINSGNRKVFETMLGTAYEQLTAAGFDIPALTPENYAAVLSGILATLDKDAVYAAALEQVTAAVEENRETIAAAVTAAVREQVEPAVAEQVRSQVTNSVTASVRAQIEGPVAAEVRAQITAAVIQSVTGMDEASYNAAVAAGEIDEETQAAVSGAIAQTMASEGNALIEETVNAQMSSEDVVNTIASTIEGIMESEDTAATIAAAIDAQMESETVQATIKETTDTQIQALIEENMNSEEVLASLAAAEEGYNTISELKDSLDSYAELCSGVQQYTAGVAGAAEGSVTISLNLGDLNTGSRDLYKGLCDLFDGIIELKDGVPTLINGVTQLKDGAMKLSDGLQQFDRDGISKLTDKLDDVNLFIERLSAIADLSANQDNSRFVYRLDEISRD